MSLSVWRAFAACFSVASVQNFRPTLSLSGCLRRAFLTPFSIQARAQWAGNSVPVLLHVYAKCIAGREEMNRRRIEEAFPDDGE